LLIAILVLVALALGIANKIRSDRRARRTSESLNQPESGHHGAGLQGTGSVADPANGGMTAEVRSAQSAINRIDLKELRAAVLAGNAKRARQCLGAPHADDVADIYAMIFEVPSGAPEIKSLLIQLLQDGPGEEASRLLYSLLVVENALDSSDWRTTALSLGKRKYVEAAPFLESVGFARHSTNLSEGEWGRKVGSLGSLLLMDPAKFMPKFVEAVESGPQLELAPYLTALRIAIEDWRIDIGPTLHSLQARFRSVNTSSGRWGPRPIIAEALESYIALTQSTEVRAWLDSELRSLIEAGAAAPDDVDELDHYRNIVSRLKRR